jgi:hypothetical protein
MKRKRLPPEGSLFFFDSYERFNIGITSVLDVPFDYYLLLAIIVILLTEDYGTLRKKEYPENFIPTCSVFSTHLHGDKSVFR